MNNPRHGSPNFIWHSAIRVIAVWFTLTKILIGVPKHLNNYVICMIFTQFTNMTAGHKIQP
jgi:hypothetical protein